MSSHPILLIGGYGVVGRQTARQLRMAHPGTPLLIAGRDPGKAEQAAAEIGDAEGVAIDLAADDLGLGERPVSAVAVLFTDERIAGRRFAQARGVPHLSISSGLHEIAPEVATYMHRPDAAAVVLGAEWLVGATTVPTLHLAERFARVDAIALGALVDEQDTGGPAVAADFERLSRTLPAALTRRDGAYAWCDGDEAKATFRAVDGTTMDAAGFSSIDIVGLATATGAPNVRFAIATGVSSTRRRGELMSTEIVIELAGVDHAGEPLRTRHAVVHPEGTMPLTGLGVAMVLERLLGLDGRLPTLPGLYFPYQLLDPTAHLARLKEIGGELLTLER